MEIVDRVLSNSLHGKGEWYLRATFDDGSKLGSAANTEARIDSLRIPGRSYVVALTRNALLWRWIRHGGFLFERDEKLVQLFDPPFDCSEPSPVTSKATLPEYVKTAVNIPMLQFGWRWRWHSEERGPVRPGYCVCSTLSNSPVTGIGLALWGRTLRGCGGRLSLARKNRPGWLVLVHRFIGMDVPGLGGRNIRPQTAG